jgi:signal transduction histidine kinase
MARRLGWLGARVASLLGGGGFQRTLFVWTALGLLLVVATFFVLGLRAVQESSQRALDDRLVLTEVAARNLDLVLRVTLDDLVSEASRFSFDPQEGITEGQRAMLRWAVKRMAIFNYHISLVDREGTIRWVEPYTPSLIGSSLAYRPFVQEMLAEPRPRISNLISSLSGKPIIMLVAPLTDRQGSFSGFLSGEIDLTESVVTRFLPTVEIGEQGYIQVIDSHGNALMSSRPQDKSPVQYDQMGHLRSMVAERQPKAGTCYQCHEGPGGLNREREVIAFYPLSVAPWGVIVRQPEAAAMASVWRLAQEFLWVGLAALVVAMSLVWVSTRQVFNPLRALTAAAARISLGDFAVTIPKARSNEVGQLAESFDLMRVKVRDLLEQERRWRETLEAEVQKATKELASLCEISQAVNRASLNRRELLGAVLDKVVEAIEPADAGLLFLLEQGKGLVPAASVGYDQAALSRVVLKPGEGVAGKALKEGLVVCNSKKAWLAARRSLSKRNRLYLDRAAASLPPLQSALALPLVHADQREGVLVVISHNQEDAFTPQHISLASSVADQVAVGLVNARLYEELQRREASRGDLLRKLISAQEEERRRVARELHDEAGQALTAVMMSAARAEQALPAEMKEAKARLVEARSRASQALDDVRRLIYDLRPQVLDDLGLVPALRWFVKNRLGAVGLENRLEISGIDGRLPGQIEVTVFRIVQEALTNIIRHSEATRVIVRLSLKDSLLSGMVEDDGKGFAADEVLSAQRPQEGWGLRGMEERVHLLGGTLTVQSQPGRGTRIHFRIPLESFREGAQKDEQDTSFDS